MARLLSNVFLSILLLPLTARTFDNPPNDQPTDEEKLFVELTNKERAKENLPPLKVNLTLWKVARAHSENQAKQGMMAHDLDGKGPSDRVDNAGYNWAAVAENVATSNGFPAKKIMEGWMASPHHHDNIMNKDYTEVGIGVARKGDQVYYTQVFAKPR